MLCVLVVAIEHRKGVICRTVADKLPDSWPLETQNGLRRSPRTLKFRLNELCQRKELPPKFEQDFL